MASRPWEGLRADLLARIFRRLPSLADGARSSVVCRHWRGVSRHNPPQLPWLLMPSTAGTACFRVFDGTTHTDQFPGVPHGARFCGSFPGGWFVVALPAPGGGNRLLNLLSGEELHLPDRVGAVTRGPKKGALDLNSEAPFSRASASRAPVEHCEYPMSIHAATMSAAPTPGGTYIVAAVTSGQTNIAFWRPGMERWSPPLPTEVNRRASWSKMIPRVAAVEDVAYSRRGGLERFYVLTVADSLVSYEPADGADGALTMRRRAFKPRVLAVTPHVLGKPVARYLVASGEDLLMVRRFATLAVEDVMNFQVLKLHEEEGEGSSCSWRTGNRLEGQVLFLGRGCSRAYATGISEKPGPGYIYFLDDGEDFHDFQDIPQGQKQYRCSDTGRCHCEHATQETRRVLPREPPSDCSPWIWFFH